MDKEKVTRLISEVCTPETGFVTNCSLGLWAMGQKHSQCVHTLPAVFWLCPQQLVMLGSVIPYIPISISNRKALFIFCTHYFSCLI